MAQDGGRYPGLLRQQGCVSIYSAASLFGTPFFFDLAKRELLVGRMGFSVARHCTELDFLFSHTITANGGVVTHLQLHNYI